MGSEFSPKRLLVTGGAGFIGSNFARLALALHPDIRIWNLDSLTYAGNLSSLSDVVERWGEKGEGRHHFVRADIRDSRLVRDLIEKEAVDTVVHFAAESHVDRSILGPEPFLGTNVEGTFRLLEACRDVWGGSRDVRFHHVSTDEVYGSLGSEGLFTESTPYDPSSPYSASKAASDHFVRAWHRTFGLPVTITNCSNNYGPYQFPEKLIPLTILNCVDGKPIPVYGRGENVRDWLYVDDHCSAIDVVVRRGPPGSTYNVGGDGERKNLDIVRGICAAMDELRPRVPAGLASHSDLITFVKDRPGHDFRYAMDFSRLRSELGWSPSVTLEEGLRKTVAWYLENGGWCRCVASGDYRRYYETQYGAAASRDARGR